MSEHMRRVFRQAAMTSHSLCERCGRAFSGKALIVCMAKITKVQCLAELTEWLRTATPAYDPPDNERSIIASLMAAMVNACEEEAAKHEDATVIHVFLATCAL